MIRKRSGGALVLAFLGTVACGAGEFKARDRATDGGSGTGGSQTGGNGGAGARTGQAMSGGAPSSGGASVGGSKATAGSGGTAGGPGSGGSMVDSGTGGSKDSGSSGACAMDGGAGCSLACSGNTPVCENGICVECETGSARCGTSDTPEVCQNGAWVQQPRCKGAAPTCSFGVCGNAVVAGGTVTVEDGVLSAASFHLVEHGFEFSPTTCGTIVGQKVCVTGGLRP